MFLVCEDNYIFRTANKEKDLDLYPKILENKEKTENDFFKIDT